MLSLKSTPNEDVTFEQILKSDAFRSRLGLTKNQRLTTFIDQNVDTLSIIFNAALKLKPFRDTSEQLEKNAKIEPSKMMNTAEELELALKRYQENQKKLEEMKNEFEERGGTLRIPRFFEIKLQARVRKFSVIDNVTNFKFFQAINTNEVISIYQHLCEKIAKIRNDFTVHKIGDDVGESSKFYLTGAIGVGKTLGAMVTAARLKTMENVRVLYIHDVAMLIFSTDEPEEVFQKELFAAFCFDKDAELRDQLANSSSDDWPKLVRNYIIKNRLVLVSIWDNVNACYDNHDGSFIYKASKLPPANFHVNGLTKCCNEIVLCLASFNNSPTDTLFTKPDMWTQLIMNPVDETERIKLIESLDPFGNLFQQLSDNDKNYVLNNIQYLTSSIPLEISLINDSIEDYRINNNVKDMPVIEVICQSLEIYQEKALRSIETDHWNKFQTTLSKNDKKKEIFERYVLCMNARVPLIKKSIMRSCLDNKLMRLVDTVVPGLKEKYCMIKPIHNIAQKIIDELYTYLNEMKHIEDNLRFLHFNLKIASAFGNMIEFVLSKHIQRTSYQSPLFDNKPITYNVELINISKPVLIDFYSGVYKNCEIAFIRPSSEYFIAFDFMAYIKPNIEKNQKKELKLYQVTVNDKPWIHIYTSVGNFINKIKDFKKIFSFNDQELFENITLVWMIDKRNKDQMDTYQQDYLKLKKDERKVNQLLEDYKLNRKEDKHNQYLCIVFQFNNEFHYFQDLGIMFNSELLKDYSKLKDLCDI